tara:strand:+ start:43 stop:282 length:240 start_codon:yes stop_codon:yes gene_type:complete
MKPLTFLLIVIIKLYQFFISPLIGNNCRYLPTCSNYFIDSLKEFGFFKGIFVGSKRIISCHPFKFLGGGEGFDPVKKRK